jgi:dienelactone hydrolase
MLTSLNLRRIFAIFTVFFCVTTLGSLYCYDIFRNISIDEQQENASKLHIEVLHSIATDGTALKALLYVKPHILNSTDSIVPLVIVCHGMGDNYFAFNDLCYTLSQRGYVVIAPEFRGHGSNPAPLTFGIKEPFDIIQWLDYAENKFSFVNISNSGIFGFSMGGYYATMAYIHESLGRNRFRTLIEVSGPINVTRNLSEITNQPDILGPLPIFQDIEKKNAISYINETFPQNILIIHGSADSTVDIQNTYDFLQAADPYHNRNDITYYIYPGIGHVNTGFNDTTYQYAIKWFDFHLKGLITEPSEIYIRISPISKYTGMIMYYWLLAAIVSAMFCLGSGYYMVFPQFFSLNNSSSLKMTEESENKSKSESNKGHEQEKPIQTQNNDNSWRLKGIYLGIYFGVIAFISLILSFFRPMIYFQILIIDMGLITAFILSMWYAKKKKMFTHAQFILKASTNRKNAFVFSGIVVLGFLLFLLIMSNPNEINTTLGPGARFTWLVPLFAVLILLFLETTILFLRSYIFSKLPKNMIERVIETISISIFFAITLGLAFIGGRTVTYFGGSMIIMILQMGFGLGFLTMMIVHIMEHIHNSIHPTLIFLSIAIAIAIGASQIYLIF